MRSTPPAGTPSGSRAENHKAAPWRRPTTLPGTGNEYLEDAQIGFTIAVIANRRLLFGDRASVAVNHHSTADLCPKTDLFTVVRGVTCRCQLKTRPFDAEKLPEMLRRLASKVPIYENFGN